MSVGTSSGRNGSAYPKMLILETRAQKEKTTQDHAETSSLIVQITPDHAENSTSTIQTTRDHAKTSRSTDWDYQKCKTEMKKKPRLRHIFYIMELDMLLQQLIKLYIGMLKIEYSNPNQLKQLVELTKLNVHLLSHEPHLPQYTSKLFLEELDGLLADQASTSTQHDDRLQNIKEIYDELEKAKANAGKVEFFDQNLIEVSRKLIFQAKHKLTAPVEKIKEVSRQLENADAYTGQVEFDQNLIVDIRKLTQQYHEEVQAEHQLAQFESSIDPNGLDNTDVPPAHIFNLLPLEFRTASAKSNLDLVKENLILLKQVYSDCNNDLKDKLVKITSNVIDQIPSVDPDHEVSDPQVMKLHAVRIIQLMCSPKSELYIHKMDSFKDICNQVAAMYKHHHHHQNGKRTDENYTWCGSFQKDIFYDNWEAVEKFLEENPLALTAKITVDGNTALHLAVKARKVEMVRKLSGKLKEKNRHIEILEKQNIEGKTALYIAASSSGDPIFAEELRKTNEDILLIESNNETIPLLPLFVAAKHNNKDMVKYIYHEMQNYKKKEKKLECFQISEANLKDQKAKVWVKQWASFLADLIYNEDYDMALRVIRDYPSLGLSKYTDVETPLFALAQSRYLGADVKVPSKTSIFQFIPFKICGNKNDDVIASKDSASKLLEQIILNIDDLQSQKSALSAAFFKAAEVGSVEFVAMFIDCLPMVVSWLNDQYHNIFHVAIINRKEKIFNLIYGLGSVKNDLTGSADKSNKWMLHLAGEMVPIYRLNQVPGPAMQLQRELQWFQAVEEIVPNNSLNVKNLGKESKTPHELFTSTHENLLKDGQEWMRNTASSCSIVAALIATVMFAAAFTLPGGNNQNTGFPIFQGDISFLVFAVSDLVALSTSCTSVLIFLAILTSRFAQEDFLKSLQMRLYKGLFLLFVSMAAMMVAFCDTIYIITRHQYNWFIPIIVVAGLIPVFTFSRMMFPLLSQLRQATINPIFDKGPRRMCY